MTGTEVETFAIELNGGASIGATVLFQFSNLAKAMVEQLTLLNGATLLQHSFKPEDEDCD